VWKRSQRFREPGKGVSTTPFHGDGDRIIGCRRMENAIDDQMLVAHSQERQLSAASGGFSQRRRIGAADEDQRR
jgi:hypothetical protein